jgi:SSS family solute:Na+ symporter
MFVPFFVILPGLLALVLLKDSSGHLIQLYPDGSDMVLNHGAHSYNEVLPLMMVRYLGPGLLGLGITALIAGFMSGMAGNVSAFATVWTYDIYRAMFNRNKSDAHYVAMGRWCTVVGVAVSVGTSYLVRHSPSIMDYVQELFSFFIAPLFGTVILGMMWKRATAAGGFWGLFAGTSAAIALWWWVRVDPSAVQYVALSPHAKDMAVNMFRALWAWVACVSVTVLVSLVTRPKPAEELVGLVYGYTRIPSEGDMPIYQRPIFWAGVVGVVFVILNIIFW